MRPLPNIIFPRYQNLCYDLEFSKKHLEFLKLILSVVLLSRCDNGYKLGSDLSEMISDRAKLEDNYGKSIKAWSTKWKNQLEKESPEYETTKEAWSAFLEAGSKQANVHIDLSKTLINYPVFKIKDWLKRSYQKSFINYKQTKEFEENFEEAQSAWIELYDRMKKRYLHFFAITLT